MDKTTNYGWKVNSKTVEGIWRAHVMPLNDLRNHIESIWCWCKPLRDDEDNSILIHNSADDREKYERGERKLT